MPTNCNRNANECCIFGINSMITLLTTLRELASKEVVPTPKLAEIMQEAQAAFTDGVTKWQTEHSDETELN